MGCLNCKPKPQPQTIVVHSCDYHTDHSSNGIVRILKSRSPSPSRYAADTRKIVPTTNEKDVHPNFVRQKPVAQPKRNPTSSPSPHIALPNEEKTTLHVMDAEDLEPADYNLIPEPNAGTQSRLSNQKSEATVSKIKLKSTVSATSAGTSLTSKQSLLSSQDTLHVEEFDSEMDDFSRMRLVSNRRPMSESHLSRNKTFVVKHGCRLPYRPNSERIRPMPDVAWS